MRALPLASLCLALSWQALPALAQTPPENSPQLEEARNQYRAGVAAFGRRHYPEAVVAFERSFRARPHPATLYNAAEARMNAGDNPGALAQLRDLLAMTDPAPDPELAGRARVLAEQMGEHNLQPTPRVVAATCPSCPPPPPPPPPPVCPPPEVVRTRISPVAWALAGGSLALMSVGAGFFAVAVDNAASFRDPLATQEFQLQLRDQGETYRIIGITGMVLGVGAAVGAVWMFTHPTTTPSASNAVARVNFGVSPNGVSLGGTF